MLFYVSSQISLGSRNTGLNKIAMVPNTYILQFTEESRTKLFKLVRFMLRVVFLEENASLYPHLETTYILLPLF